MAFLDKNNKFVSYLIILLSLFIVVLVTRVQIMTLQENLDVKEIKTNELNDKKEQRDDLDRIKAKLKSDDSKVGKYLTAFNEDELIDYIYSYIESTLSTEGGITEVKNISFTEWEKNEIWFTESNIIIKLRVPNVEKMKNILDFLTDSESKYNFFVDSFTYPNVDTESSFNITIPLRVLYK